MRIYARDTTVEKLDKEEASAFVTKNHRQGAITKADALSSYGLFHKGALVGVAQFCIPRTAGMKKKYSVELLRMAFQPDVRVIGGESKLIEHFKKVAKPADIFTYQDTTGETKLVYEHAGFSLVSESKKKQYLVAPGKTRETAGKKECYSIDSVVMRGPDALLGTSLGEIFREEGKRKTNPELFVQELGWHIEENSGDRIYEWINEDITFYTYKTTAIDSDKYYYGVSSVRIKNATRKDCEKTNYFGSGGIKFRNWRKRHEDNLVKEVINTYPRKAPAYAAEEKLVAQLHFSDPLCLNSVKGGRRRIHEVSPEYVYELRECEIHGMTTFRRNNCSKCLVAKRTNLRECPTHGLVKHQGRTCYICIQEKVAVKKECQIHGHTPFIGNNCRLCMAEKSFKLKLCSIHGETPHHGSQCAKCQSENRTYESECVIHGVTKFQGNYCYKCIANDKISMRECSIHGYTKHSKDSCFKCAVASRYTEKDCPIHGLGKHTKSGCIRCSTRKNFTVKECPIHGETKHSKDSCYKCTAESHYTEKDCPIHGLGKHTKSGCARCSTRKRSTFKECPIHGHTKHSKDSCFKCTVASRYTEKGCPIHGLGKHTKSGCVKCSVRKRFTIKECPIHGETKHSGSTCSRCHSQKIADKI